MNALIMEEYRDLFKSPESFCEFVNAIREKSADDFSPVLSGQEVIGSIMSPEATKDFILDRLVRRLSKKPGTFSEIQRRIECDKIVDVEDMI